MSKTRVCCKCKSILKQEHEFGTSSYVIVTPKGNVEVCKHCFATNKPTGKGITIQDMHKPVQREFR